MRRGPRQVQNDRASLVVDALDVALVARAMTRGRDRAAFIGPCAASRQGLAPAGQDFLEDQVGRYYGAVHLRISEITSWSQTARVARNRHPGFSQKSWCAQVEKTFRRRRAPR